MTMCQLNVVPPKKLFVESHDENCHNYILTYVCRHIHMYSEQNLMFSLLFIIVYLAPLSDYGGCSTAAAGIYSIQIRTTTILH